MKPEEWIRYCETVARCLSSHSSTSSNEEKTRAIKAMEAIRAMMPSRSSSHQQLGGRSSSCPPDTAASITSHHQQFLPTDATPTVSYDTVRNVLKVIAHESTRQEILKLLIAGLPPNTTFTPPGSMASIMTCFASSSGQFCALELLRGVPPAQRQPGYSSSSSRVSVLCTPFRRWGSPSNAAAVNDRQHIVDVDAATAASAAAAFDGKECVICYEPRAGQVALVPCGHANICNECIHGIYNNNNNNHDHGNRKCPVCRAQIHTVMRIYQ